MAIDPNTLIALEAHDLLPETWDALQTATDTYGPDALKRRHDRVIKRIFGVLVTDEEMELLNDVVIEYAGIKLALAIVPAGIDYWSAQAMSHTAGQRESKAYKDRSEHLRKIAEGWTREAAALWPDVQPLIPIRPGRAVDAPRVIQAGETVAHITANIDDMEPLYGAAEDLTTGGAT